jgi:NDP-sugar pyrophosphorylase family protein
LSIEIGGIMAAGQGRRIGARSKALVVIEGIPLIDFILADMASVDIRKVVIVCRPDDVDLIDHLKKWESKFDEVEVLLQSEPGTLGAVRQLMAAADGARQVLSTCDVVARSGSLAQLIRCHLGSRVDPLMTILTSELVEDEAPIWVDADSDGGVLDMGKILEPTGRVFANIRVIGAALAREMSKLDLAGTAQDSVFMGVVTRGFPGSVRWHDGDDVLDVDRPEDAESARRLVRFTSAWEAVRRRSDMGRGVASSV